MQGLNELITFALFSESNATVYLTILYLTIFDYVF